jgi:hypothetical protein
VLQEEVQLALRKLHTAELRCAQLQQKLEGRTQDYDTLYYTHQKMKEEMDLMRQQLHEATARLRSDVEDGRGTIRKAPKPGEVPDAMALSLGAGAGASLPKDSIKAFNKMKDTIKLLTKVAKSKDDKIVKLEKDLQMKTDLLLSMNRRADGRLQRVADAADRTPTASERYALHSADGMADGADSLASPGPTLEGAMLALKAEVVHLSRSGLAALDRIAATVSRSAGLDLFKKAHAFVRRVVADVIGEAGLQEGVWPLGDRDIERIKPHHRLNAAKALREMVICYDMIPDFIKTGLSVCDDIVRNRVALVKIARFCIAYERTNRPDGSPVRGKTSPTHDRDDEKPVKQKRSSSASSNRSSNATIHSRDTTPSQKAAFAGASHRTTSYVSPKRQTPSHTLATGHGLGATRHASPKPGAYVAYSPNGMTSPPPAAPPAASNKGRTLSPRPGTTVTPTRLKSKTFSPTNPSPEPPAARRLDPHTALRTSSPVTASVDKGGTRSQTPKTMKKGSANSTASTAHSASTKAPSDDHLDPGSPDRPDLESIMRKPPPVPRCVLGRPESPHSTPPSTPKYTLPVVTKAPYPSRLADLRQQTHRSRSPQN